MDFFCVYNSPLTGKNYVKYVLVDGMYKAYTVYRYFKTEEALARFHAILQRIQYFLVEVGMVEYRSHGLIYRLHKSLKPTAEVLYRREYGTLVKHPPRGPLGKRFVKGYIPITQRKPGISQEQASWQYSMLGRYVPPQNFWTPRYREMLDSLEILETAERIVVILDLGEDW